MSLSRCFRDYSCAHIFKRRKNFRTIDRIALFVIIIPSGISLIISLAASYRIAIVTATALAAC